MTASAQLPRYKCHKEVHALKIEGRNASMTDGVLLHFHANDGFDPIHIPEEEVKPFLDMSDNDQGYLVIYEDGYRSWSPTKAFEDGYSLMKDDGARI